MEKAGRDIYQKHNSFVEIRHRHDDALTDALNRVAALRNDVHSSKGLPQVQAPILEEVFIDLLDNNEECAEPRFSLAPNVVEEIATYSDDVLARYLVHRYRY